MSKIEKKGCENRLLRKDLKIITCVSCEYVCKSIHSGNMNHCTNI